MDDALRGESGRLRIPHDNYMTPAENVAALSIGLNRAGIALPPIVLDPCGGRGELASELMLLEPTVRVALTDLRPDPGAISLYAASSPLDATIVADLDLALRLSGARAIVSNPPFKSGSSPGVHRRLWRPSPRIAAERPVSHRRREAQLRSRIPAAHRSALIPNIILKRRFPPTS